MLFRSLLVGCKPSSQETTNVYSTNDVAFSTNDVRLSFYIVSQARIEGGRFIDTTELPKLGYIAATPELTITRLESVTADISQRREVMIDGNGKRTILPDQNQPAIIIKLPKAEASQFTSLTKRVVGKQLLIALGERRSSFSVGQ